MRCWHLMSGMHDANVLVLIKAEISLKVLEHLSTEVSQEGHMHIA